MNIKKKYAKKTEHLLIFRPLNLPHPFYKSHEEDDMVFQLPKKVSSLETLRLGG